MHIIYIYIYVYLYQTYIHMSLPSFQYAMYHSLRRHDLTAHLYAGFGRPSSTPSASVLGLANLCTNSFF